MLSAPLIACAAAVRHIAGAQDFLSVRSLQAGTAGSGSGSDRWLQLLASLLEGMTPRGFLAPKEHLQNRPVPCMT